MAQVLNFNIHDILKFQVIRKGGWGLRDRINLKFLPFLVESIDRPDIVLNIGSFTPSNRGCYLVDHKYYVKEGYLYCRDSQGAASWEVEVKGLEEVQTIVNFYIKARWGLQSLLNPDLLPQVLLLRLLRYKLLQKGYLLLHSAAVSKEGRAYLLSGRGSSFKTSLCMDFVRRAGFTCLGDDYVLVGENEVLGLFVLNPHLFQFMARHLADETAFGLLARLRCAWHLLRSPSFPPVMEAGPAEPKALVLLARSTRLGEVGLTPYPNKEGAASRLQANNQMEEFTYQLPAFGVREGPFLRYMMAYAFLFPHSWIARSPEVEREFLSNFLRRIPVFQAELPLKYSPTVFPQLYRLLTGV